MRQIKRILIFVLELMVVPAGLFVSLLLAALAGAADEFFAPFAFTVGLTVTLLAFARLRRKTRAWKIQYDAAGWAFARAERKRNPVRARCKRIAERVAICIPTAIAAFVLFFLPVATHLVHPGGRPFRHYRVPVPWTQAVFSEPESPWDNYATIFVLACSSGRGRFGMTPVMIPFLFSRDEPLLSSFTFFSRRNEPGTVGVTSPSGPEDTPSRQFQSHGLTINCWQYLSRHGSRVWQASEPIWEIYCETPAVLERQNAGHIPAGLERDRLSGRFTGVSTDIPTFYRIIEGIRPVT